MSDSSNLAYPQDKVRIAATYHAGQVGDVIPEGQPETIDIQLNDDVLPAGPGERLVFLTRLIDTLFRGDPTEITPDVTVDPDPADLDPADPAPAPGDGGAQ